MPSDEEIIDSFFDGLAVIFKVALGLVLLAIILCILQVQCRFSIAPLPDALQPVEEERVRIRERHQFHGITTSIEENGERYFIRNGRRHRL